MHLRAALIFLVACKSHHEPKAPVAKVVDAAVELALVDAAVVVDAAVPLGRTACDQPAEWHGGASFLTVGRIVHLRVAAAQFGAEWGHDRCVALDFELVDSFHGEGSEKTAEHIKVVVRQSMITHYTSRPAGAWWIVEQTLEPGTEYLAFCPTGPLTTSLFGSCAVTSAAPLLADVRFARDAETKKLALDPALAAMRTICKTASFVAAGYVWERFAEGAVKDPAIYDKVIALIEEPSCSTTFRDSLFNVVQDLRMMDSTPHLRRLTQGMFRLLAMPEAGGLHDNLIVTWIPNTVGIEGGGKKLTAAQVFTGAAARRAEAGKALAGYKGTGDANPVRAWLK